MSERSPQLAPFEKDEKDEKTTVNQLPEASIYNGSAEDLLARQDTDPALKAKMHIVNNTIDEMGWTPYHWKLFVLNGFGYAVDSLILLLQSIIATPAGKEFNPSFANALTIAVYVGMLTGALFWGLSADVIGRKIAFNTSLFICSIAGIVAGAAPNWISLAFFISLVGFGGGGNLILDTTVFLEYLPSNKQYVLTLLACWWGLGQAIAGLIAWGCLVPAYLNCDPTTGQVCTYDNNKGWRILMFTASGMVFVMSILRITVIRLRETPKYLLGEGKEAELVENFHVMARKYNRPCSITLEQLQACGTINSAHSKSKFSVGELLVHLRGLFATKVLGLSTSLIWLSWLLIGLAYPLFYVFLSTYIETRVPNAHLTPNEVWRNYALTNISGIPGPILAAWLCNQKILGRKYTMVIGAVATMAFFFGLTQITTEAADIGMNCAIGFVLNIYYGTLYAYTAEALPSAHRATGNGIAVAFNRLMGIMSAIIAAYANTKTSVPLWICAVLFLAMAAVSAGLPFEPYGRRSS